MRSRIEVNRNSISLQRTVRAIEFVKDVDLVETVDVTVKGESEPRRYDAVFNSAPLGALQRTNLSGLNLNWGTK